MQYQWCSPAAVVVIGAALRHQAALVVRGAALRQVVLEEQSVVAGLREVLHICTGVSTFVITNHQISLAHTFTT